MEVNTKNVISKIKLSVCVCLFFITITISNFLKPNINYINGDRIAKDITGVGKIKSEKIINEKEVNGFYKNEKDFYSRMKDLGIGEITYNRIKKTYRFGD